MHLVVHIGPFKTGTSSVQATLLANTPLLTRHGIRPFHVGETQIMDLSVRYAAPEKNLKGDVAQLFGDATTALRHSEEYWSRLETSAPATPVAVLSSEYFSDLGDPAAFYARLKSFADKVTVVAYVRDPVGLFVSALQEEIKGKGASVLPRPISNFRVRYRDFLTAATSAVGRKNVIVRNFDRKNLHGGDVVSDFTEILRRFTPVPDLIRHSANQSLPGAAVAWLIRNEHRGPAPFNRVKQRETARRMMEVPAIAALAPLRMDSLAWEATIRSNTAPVCQWVNRFFLQDQLPLRLTPDAVQAFTRQDFPSKYHWIMSYLTPEADALITQSLA